MKKILKIAVMSAKSCSMFKRNVTDRNGKRERERDGLGKRDRLIERRRKIKVFKEHIYERFLNIC